MTSSSPGFDIVGVGFGPSNLALAVAIEEHNLQVAATGGDPLAGMFFERRPEFGWHRGMLLPNATVQVSFLKDLATMRNPASTFSFVAYLHERGRLADFINHKTLFPLRVEFNDYFAWAANRLEHLVTYSSEVTEVRPVIEDGVITAFDVTVGRPTKQVDVRRARNVVIAAGLTPHLPDGVTSSDRVWHSSELLSRLEGLAGGRPPRRFVVVGAGQSAAETTEFLCTRFPDAEVCAVFSRFGYSPSDDSSFTNRIFDPPSVDTFYSAPEDVKQMLSAYHRNTNYSVVDSELIDALFRRVYAEKVTGHQRLRIMNASRVVDLAETADGVLALVEFLPNGEISRLASDVIIYATGYRPSDPTRVLGRTARLCRRDGAGRLSIGRDHRLDLTIPGRAGLFVTGASEHAHGLSATLLSNVAVRAGELVEAMLTETIDLTNGSPSEGQRPATPTRHLKAQPSAREAS
ncbi:MAG TPA: lysine N(6)-hydroxylase/L-ornithine N(5)-oxygenase family protein [Acidimicrobiia bacterium]|nr:lysine N(6)-hydroxylase/L-ornithine N(5)-oxygenase family protein [Acidimicrobiia bacterium]